MDVLIRASLCLFTPLPGEPVRVIAQRGGETIFHGTIVRIEHSISGVTTVQAVDAPELPPAQHDDWPMPDSRPID